MPRNYPKHDPDMFNEKYRRYVAAKELHERVAKRDLTAKPITHETMYINVPYNLFSSLVKNSHQYPRGHYNVISPYEQKRIKGSYLHKDLNDTPVYWGSHKYYRGNCPRLRDHWE